MEINILGTPYEIIVKKYDEDEVFDRRGFAGYCDGYNKEIVLCDMTTYKGWQHEEPKTAEICFKANLRHEIVHAFYNESGLCDNACTVEDSWARNEEMVDWIALQGPKIYKAWQEAGAI